MARKKVNNKSKKKKNNDGVNYLEKLKDYETLYIVFFVLFFMILFCIVGYYSLRVQNKSIFSSLQKDKADNYFSVSSSIVTLSAASVLSDAEGLKQKKYLVSIDNERNNEVQYQLLFEEDEDLKKQCGCVFSDFNYSMIHYSIDQKKVLSFQDEKMVILDGVISPKEKKDLVISLWLDNSFSSLNDAHMHGHFIVKEL